MKRFLILVLLAVTLLSACATPSSDQETAQDGQLPQVIVYRPPT